jgi:hypothetical protein
MDWRIIAAIFLALALGCLPVWPYSHGWTFLPSIFCLFVMVLTLLVNLFGKKGSTIWRHKGQG